MAMHTNLTSYQKIFYSFNLKHYSGFFIPLFFFYLCCTVSVHFVLPFADLLQANGCSGMDNLSEESPNDVHFTHIINVMTIYCAFKNNKLIYFPYTALYHGYT